MLIQAAEAKYSSAVPSKRFTSTWRKSEAGNDSTESEHSKIGEIAHGSNAQTPRSDGQDSIAPVLNRLQYTTLESCRGRLRAVSTGHAIIERRQDSQIFATEL